MSDTPTMQPGAEPAAPPADAAPPEDGAQPTADFAAEIDDLSIDELNAALGFDSGDDGSSDDASPAAEPAESLPDEPPDAAPAAQDPPTKPINRRRLSTSGLNDDDREIAAKAIDMVRSGDAPDLATAFAALTGAQPAPAANPDDASDDDDADAAATTPPAPAVEEIQSRIAELRAQRKTAKQDFDADEELRITEEIENASMDLIRAEQAAQSQRQQINSYDTEYRGAVDEMETKYVDLLDDESSPFAEMLDDAVLAARARKAPELSDPRHIIAIADRIAGFLNPTAAVTSPKPTSRTPSPIPPQPAKRPTGSAVAPSGSQKPVLAPKQAAESIARASREELAAALWG